MVGFKVFNINRRKDVKLRAVIMLGTFIFLSHSVGIMCISIVYLFLKINLMSLSLWVILGVTLIGAALSNVIYLMVSNYLWERLAISGNTGFKMSLLSLILVTPWYFIVNMFG
jgi:hypothetical protein